MFGHADLGGKGTRVFQDETGFLTGYEIYLMYIVHNDQIT